MGLVDFSPVAAAPVVHVPTPFYFGMPKFELSSIIMMCIIATVSMVESTGVYLALSDITKDPIDSTLLRNGYRAEGMAVLLGGLFNTFPYTGFSQNVGLVKLSGIKKRLPIYYTAGFLVLLGLLPKFGALSQIIPSPVLGGAMLVMFGFVSIQGMQILARVDFANNAAIKKLCSLLAKSTRAKICIPWIETNPNITSIAPPSTGLGMI